MGSVHLCTVDVHFNLRMVKPMFQSKGMAVPCEVVPLVYINLIVLVGHNLKIMTHK